VSRTTAEWRALDSAHYLHPFTDHKGWPQGARIITRGRGRLPVDSDGNRLLDGMSGLWCVNARLRPPELAEAAYRQMLELPYYNSFFQWPTRRRSSWRDQLAPRSRRRSSAACSSPARAEANDTSCGWCAATGRCRASRSGR
jgi:putrescine---pyruvate transaminase